jgi:hypothetical protein
MKRKSVYKTATLSLMIFCILHTSAYAATLEDQDVPISFKVEMLPWEQADKVIPNKTIFTIIDIETGLQFKVQRRAGNKHADVQPLTRKDTYIMKKIYGGKWSWKRRAILVLIDDQLLAASMHGMPHGAGALPNGFPGHFCVHFFGSTTHRSKHVDLWHKVMILKAAGKIKKYINDVDPYELIQIFAISVNSKDTKLLDLTVSHEHNLESLHKIVQDFDYFVIKNMSLHPAKEMKSSVLVKIPVRVEIFKEGKGKEKRTINYVVRRNSLTDPWQIDEASLTEQLK